MTTPLPTAALSPVRQLPRLAGNTARLAGHWMEDIALDPGRLKQSTVSIASLILVGSRLLVSWGDERRSRNDPEKHAIRLRDAINTTFREIGAWVGSYWVLQAARDATQVLLNWAVNLQTGPTPPTGFRRFRQQLGRQWAALTQGRPLPRVAPTPLKDLEAIASRQFGPNAPLEAGLKALTHLPMFKGMNVPSTMRALFNWAPISVGAALSIAVSGFFLEWLTLHRAEKISRGIALAVQNHRPHHRPTAPAQPLSATADPKAPPASASLVVDGASSVAGSPPATAPVSAQFFLGVQQQQMARQLPPTPATYPVSTGALTPGTGMSGFIQPG